MKRRFVCVLILLGILCGCGRGENMEGVSSCQYHGSAYSVTMKRDILCIMTAYPGLITNVVKSEDGSIYIVMKSGKSILYDDKKVKSFDEKLNNPDIQDMMEQIYPLSHISKLMPEGCNPGRIRVYSLLYEAYGGSRGQVQSNLVTVKTMGGNFMFNKNNMAAKSLQSVFDELDPAAGGDKNIHAYVFPVGGTFNYRNISGTNRLSAHSFGIAIDLARDSRDYWKWASRDMGEKRLAAYPRQIVSIFEKNSFIWGGKWGHFDILHYEYRPEIIYKARYFGGMVDSTISWYAGVPYDNPLVRSYINIIENAVEYRKPGLN